MALELGQAERANELLARLEEQAPPQEDEAGRRLSCPAAPWATALTAIGAAGGLKRLLDFDPIPHPPWLATTDDEEFDEGLSTHRT
ncbi:MAG: hypothetical protein HC822_01715 [Oscillochloris sp.]|nr:hypothetical protein [Oscillochloris sp.]